MGAAGFGLGVLAAGAAAGWVGERTLMRTQLGRDEQAAAFGSLRSTPRSLELSDGVELYLEIDEARDASPYPGLTVVFLHGYALNLDCWHFQRQAFGGLVRCVWVDQRGHGRSGRGEEGSHDIDQLGADLAEVIEAAAPEGPVVVVGHSMGGMTLLALAEQHPEWFDERVVGAGLLCTSSGGLAKVPLGLPRQIGSLVHRVAPAVVSVLARRPDLVERGRRSGSDLGGLLTRYYSFATRVPPGVVDFTSEMLGATPLAVVTDFLPTFDRHDKADAVPVLQRCATLLVGAEQDLMTPVEHTRAMARVLPGAQVRILDPGGHLSILEHPERVNADLRDLLDDAWELAAQRGLR